VWNQISTLAGVILGAVTSYLVTTASEGRRWRREQRTRWDTHRLTAYGQYATAIKSTITITVRVAADIGVTGPFTPTPYPLDVGDALPALAQADIDRAAAWEPLLMFGGEPVIEAARSWSNAVGDLEHLARTQATDPEKWQLALRTSDAARAAYYSAVRTDLFIGR